MLKVIWFMRQVNRLFGFGAVRGFGYSGFGLMSRRRYRELGLDLLLIENNG